MKTIFFAVVVVMVTAAFALPAAAATYEADENGRFVVVASVNGTPIQFHVDTGADSVVLSIKDALRAGITRSQIKASGRASIAGGGSIPTLIATVREIRLDRYVARDVEALIVDDGNALLGMSFLRRLPGLSISGRILTIDDGPQVTAAIPVPRQTTTPAPTTTPQPSNEQVAAYQRGVAAYQRGDYATATNIFRPLADRGNAAAQSYLGKLYLNGIGVAQDDAEAVRWYRKAADQGHVAAQINLGLLYVIGRVVAQDYAEAARWYRKAADRGDVDGQTILGMMYERGRGVAQDDGEAVRWYRKAADQGYAGAQTSLGMMYERGQDYAEAVKWYRKAAKQGNVAAQNNLARLTGASPRR